MIDPNRREPESEITDVDGSPLTYHEADKITDPEAVHHCAPCADGEHATVDETTGRCECCGLTS